MPVQKGKIERGPTGMIYRPLGTTGQRVSAIGLGGAHLEKLATEDEAVRLIHAAIDLGITFMDNCWDYGRGLCEIRMGKALRGGYREKVFLMTKIDGRTKESAAKQIDQSLCRLKVDCVDLMQFHEVIRLEDPDRIFAPGGAAEAMFEAKEDGKLRYIGFTGHKDPFVHLRMLDAAAAQGFRFDASQMPLNPMGAHFRSFEQEVLPRLLREGIAPLAMKSMGDGYLLKSRTITATECLHYALNLPVATVITGIESTRILNQAIRAARTFRPLSRAEVKGILAKTKKAALSGRFEPFKTDNVFDGTAENPEWLG